MTLKLDVRLAVIASSHHPLTPSPRHLVITDANALFFPALHCLPWDMPGSPARERRWGVSRVPERLRRLLPPPDGRPRPPHRRHRDPGRGTTSSRPRRSTWPRAPRTTRRGPRRRRAGSPRDAVVRGQRAGLPGRPHPRPGTERVAERGGPLAARTPGGASDPCSCRRGDRRVTPGRAARGSHDCVDRRPIGRGCPLIGPGLRAPRGVRHSWERAGR